MGDVNIHIGVTARKQDCKLRTPARPLYRWFHLRLVSAGGLPVRGGAKVRANQLELWMVLPPTTAELAHAHGPAAGLSRRGRC